MTTTRCVSDSAHNSVRRHRHRIVDGRLSLNHLVDAALDPDPMKRSIRVVDDHGDARIATKVRRPAAIRPAVHEEAVLLQEVVHDGLMRRTVGADGRQHGAARLGQVLAHGSEEWLPLSHASVALADDARAVVEMITVDPVIGER